MNDDYIAGFFDGEGCILANYSRQIHYKVLISNTNLTVLEEIRDYIGLGNVRQGDGSNIPCYNLTIECKPDVKAFLTRFVPLLRVKKAQALVMLELLETQDVDKRYELIQKLRDLKKVAIT